jgi:hypothetical protein
VILLLDMLWFRFLVWMMRDAEDVSDWCSPRAEASDDRIRMRLLRRRLGRQRNAPARDQPNDDNRLDN